MPSRITKRTNVCLQRSCLRSDTWHKPSVNLTPAFKHVVLFLWGAGRGSGSKGANRKCGPFRCFYCLFAQTRTQIKRMPVEKGPKHSAVVSSDPPRPFHLFILRQEYTDRVGSVSPQIKHSLCIPYEMYLLRFGRGGRQVLGYIKSQGPPFSIQLGQRQAVQKDEGSQPVASFTFQNKSREAWGSCQREFRI